ncbi:MAG TPA: hypothetical protein HPP59_03115 [Deltaproteobacteria bacterium]|nr:hypothetical protein [Deltaproteobacteria bacterium]
MPTAANSVPAAFLINETKVATICCGWADIECWIDLEIHQGRESKENMLSEKRLLLLQGNDMKSLSMLVGVSAVVWRCLGWVL